MKIPYTGKPKPTVEWKYEDKVLKETQQITLESTIENTALLEIKNITSTQSGVYHLYAKNCAGEATATINAVILDKPAEVRNLKCDDVTENSVKLFWDPPYLNGGCAIR